MAAIATPTIFDPKPLAQLRNVTTTSGTALYTAPASEAGVKIETILATNKTTSAVPINLYHRTGAADMYTICSGIYLPGDGAPYDIMKEINVIYLAGGSTPDAIAGNAGAASSIDLQIYGIEMKD